MTELALRARTVRWRWRRRRGAGSRRHRRRVRVFCASAAGRVESVHADPRSPSPQKEAYVLLDRPCVDHRRHFAAVVQRFGSLSSDRVEADERAASFRPCWWRLLWWWGSASPSSSLRGSRCVSLIVCRRNMPHNASE